MQYSFVALERLLETDPDAYLEEVARLREHDPKRLERFVSKVHKKLEPVILPRRRASIRALVLGEVRAPLVPR